MGKIVKYCTVCEEGFAEKFAFCPNCGGALTAYEMNPVAASPAVVVAPPAAETKAVQPEPKPVEPPAAAAFVAPMTTPTPAQVPVEEEVLFEREAPVEAKAETEKVLDDEYLPAETAAFTTASSTGNDFDDDSYQPEFQANNFQPVGTTAAGEVYDDAFHVTIVEERNSGTRNAMLLGSWLLVMTLALGGVLWSLFNKDFAIDGVSSNELMSAMLLDDVPMPIEEDEPEKKKDDDAGGGGGGGREEQDETSKGRLAPQTEKPLISPTKTIPQMDSELKMQAFTQGPERPVKVTNENYGDPNSQSYKLSDGQGSGGGQGSGRGTGQGSGIGTGAGSGIGSGMGSGIGDGIGGGRGGGRDDDTDKPPPVRPVGPTEGVKIISKPRANYTDAARQNNIQGVVRVRVTFNANGSIGSIAPVSGLGYGLTEQAIAAARSIRFEPAKRGGVPYAVTKVVEYSFTLY